MPFFKGRNEDWRANFRGPAALILNKAATTAVNKDKAVRVSEGFS